MTEFELIARYFDRSPRGPAVALGIGDDCALLTPNEGHELAVSTDMLVAGRHFFDDVDPAALGWKALAVNLSDLAAMGARPLAFTLALALPSVDEPWLAAFTSGLFACADEHDCSLIGGDTTRGPLNLCVTIFGEIATGQALRRDGAQVGDDVWVSGEVGSAALALDRLRRLRDGDATVRLPAALRDALERPTPRVALGRALVGVASAAIDVSDGLAQDLGHVLRASRCGAGLQVDLLPVCGDLASSDSATRRRFALAGGDDYELCFTAASSRRPEVKRAAALSATRVTRIGAIFAAEGLRLHEFGTTIDDPSSLRGFDHFA